jgi:AraC family transcriptional regulator, regulatory protein of adaptative response / DNA-3-methyladenine glycosylase II
VVSRALKLVSEDALDVGDLEALAERVGLGSRHLRRLFLQHLGASPVRIASTRRVHFARNLLDQTHLPITKKLLTQASKAFDNSIMPCEQRSTCRPQNSESFVLV